MNSFERSCIRSYVDYELIRILRADIASRDDLERHAEILTMLGDLTRLKILYALNKGDELCVCDLADILDREVSAISHQLRRLKDRGLVKKRRDGVTIYYRINRNEESQKAFELIESIFHGAEHLEVAYES